MTEHEKRQQEKQDRFLELTHPEWLHVDLAYYELNAQYAEAQATRKEYERRLV